MKQFGRIFEQYGGSRKHGTDREDYRELGWNYRTRKQRKYIRKKYLEEFSYKEQLGDLTERIRPSF